MWEWIRKIDVPVSNETREQVVAGTWLVRWPEIKDDTIISPRVELGEPQVEVFATESEAGQFADALRNAYTLTRCAAAKWIKVERKK